MGDVAPLTRSKSEGKRVRWIPFGQVGVVLDRFRICRRPGFSDLQPSVSCDREYVQTRFNWISLISSSSSSSPTPARFSKRSSIARLLCEPVGKADPSWYGCKSALSNRMLNAFFRSRSNFSRSVSWRSSRKLFFPFVEASGVGSAAWMFGSVKALFLSEMDSDSWMSSPAPRGIS